MDFPSNNSVSTLHYTLCLRYMRDFNSKGSSSAKIITYWVQGILFGVEQGFDTRRTTKILDRRKSVNRTFRIKAEWDDFLRKEAERRGISVNVLLNLILRRSASFDTLARGYNVISMTKRSFREIVEQIPLETLALVGEKTGANDIQNILDMIGLPSNYDSFNYLVTMHFGGPDDAMWFRGYFHKRKNIDVFHLQHDLGRGWSVYLQNYFASYLKTLKIDCKIRVYDYAVNIRVPRSIRTS